MTQPTKISSHFFFHEFFSQGIWQQNDESNLRKLLDPRLITIMEGLRTTFDKPVYINNWYWGGDKMYRGFRPQSHKSALYSQHKFGRGVDFNIKDEDPNSIRQHILNHQQHFLSLGLTRIEHELDAPGYVHLDLAWTGLNYIHVFRV